VNTRRKSVSFDAVVRSHGEWAWKDLKDSAETDMERTARGDRA